MTYDVTNIEPDLGHPLQVGMCPVVLTVGSICNLGVITDGMLELNTGCECNEIADEGVVQGYVCSFHLDDVPNYPAGVNHRILMGLLQGYQGNLVLLSTGLREQDEGVLPVMINMSCAITKDELTGGIVWRSTVSGETPTPNSKGASEVHLEHGEGIPPQCSDVGEVLVQISESWVMVHSPH